MMGEFRGTLKLKFQEGDRVRIDCSYPIGLKRYGLDLRGAEGEVVEHGSTDGTYLVFLDSVEVPDGDQHVMIRSDALQRVD